MYRCETTSLVGFVQQVATGYLTHGYYFYVTGHIPDGKDPRAVDAKLVERYGIGVGRLEVGRSPKEDGWGSERPVPPVRPLLRAAGDAR
jgi:hypothetical protein